MDESNKPTLTGTSKALSMQLEPLSPAMRTFIKKQIGMLAIQLGRPMTDARLTLYAEKLQYCREHELRIAFARLDREWTADKFDFPQVADILARIRPEMLEEPQFPEWKSFTAEQIAERAKDAPEMANWWRSLKQQIAKIGLKQREKVALKPLIEPMREMTELEYAERIALLKRQAEEAKRKYGA